MFVERSSGAKCEGSAVGTGWRGVNLESQRSVSLFHSVGQIWVAKRSEFTTPVCTSLRRARRNSRRLRRGRRDRQISLGIGLPAVALVLDRVSPPSPRLRRDNLRLGSRAKVGAGGRNRTDTGSEPHGILSPDLGVITGHQSTKQGPDFAVICEIRLFRFGAHARLKTRIKHIPLAAGLKITSARSILSSALLLSITVPAACQTPQRCT
jgi:hypothetical protein